MKWKWEKLDTSRNATSGDFSKIFRNVDIDTPGLFKANSPSSAASLLAREVIQNSWDSALEMRGQSPNTPPPIWT